MPLLRDPEARRTVEEQIQYPWRGFSHPGDTFYQRGDVYDLPSIQFKES